MKPFVKWVGGKTQLLNEINNLIVNTTYNRIVEPFVGGGAFFIDRKNDSNLINDINSELIISYLIIKNSPQKLIDSLEKYELNHSNDFFYETRSKKVESLSQLEIASRFIYLNKSGFNGIYRVNSKGEFNVPFGKKEKVNIFEKTNIFKLSNFLNSSSTKILNESYKSIFKRANLGDLYFIDPPYDKLNNSFTSYQKDDFGIKEQVELSKQIIKLNNKGIKFILTNNNTNLIKKLYSDFEIKEIETNRMINSKGDKRLKTGREVIITNINMDKKDIRTFENKYFLDSLLETNMRISDFVNWTKIDKNLSDVEYKLNQLNILITKDEETFTKKLEFLFEKDKSSFEVLPLLIATRDKKMKFIDEKNDLKHIDFEKLNLPELKNFLNNFSLKELFIYEKIKSTLDYVLGVEVGLDTNSRKNRTGKNFENMIEKFLIEKNIKYQKQYKILELVKNKDKVFDFIVFQKDNKKILIEVNFYNTSGSKPSAIVGDYIKLNEEIKKTNEYEFIWITDGGGWNKMKNNITEALLNIDKVYNFNLFKKYIEENLENFIKN